MATDASVATLDPDAYDRHDGEGLADEPHAAGPTRHPVPPPFGDLRDHFAGLALRACMENGGYDSDQRRAVLARLAYRMADAMLAARGED